MTRLIVWLVAVGSTVACSAPALAGQLAAGETIDISIGRVVAALLLSLSVAVALVLLLRKRGIGLGPGPGMLGSFGRGGRIRVLEARRISIHADVCLVCFDNTEFLILCGPGGCQVLASQTVNLVSPDANSAE